MHLAHSDNYNSFEDFKNFASHLIGKEDADAYLEYISDLLSHPQFCTDNCKILFCPNNVPAYVKQFPYYQKFKEDSLWASFHPCWEQNFGQIVIRKNLYDIYITMDPKLAKEILDTQSLDCTQVSSEMK